MCGLFFFLRASSKDRTTIVEVSSSKKPVEALNLICNWLKLRGWRQIGGDTEKKILSFKGLKDLNESGLLLEISLESNINDNLLLKACINKIWGDENMNDDYRFNQMEDFSHLRFEMEYLF